LSADSRAREGQYRGAPQSATKAKDHARQNRDLIKALARKAKERAATQVERQAQPAFKMKKFATIDSKLAKVPATPGRFQNFLRKGSGVVRHHPVGEKSPRDGTDSTKSSQEALSANEISAQVAFLRRFLSFFSVFSLKMCHFSPFSMEMIPLMICRLDRRDDGRRFDVTTQGEEFP
jgi:hypothetical protein